MRTRNLVVACGTIFSLFAAGQAVGQQEQPTKTPTNSPALQPKEIKPIEFPDAKTRTTASNAPSILRDMEGVWRVDVMCHSEHWKSKAGDRTRTPSEDRDRVTEPNRVRDPANRDAPGRPTEPPTPRTEPATPNDPNPDPNNPNQIKDPFKKNDPNQPATGQPSMVGAKNYVGYAETKLIMGDNILQQKIIVPDMLSSGTGRTPGRIDGAGTQPSANTSEMFRGLSFITFDADSQQYHCAFMDSRSGRIHCDSGTYNESDKRLVFNGREGNRTGEKNLGKGMHDDHNVRVVVEILSPTQHRVTMYNVDAASTTTPDRSTPSRTTPSNPTDSNAPKTTPSQPDRTRDLNHDAADRDGTIIYQATYTKASNDDSTKYRRLIEEPGTSMTDRDRELDRNDNSK